MAKKAKKAKKELAKNKVAPLPKSKLDRKADELIKAIKDPSAFAQNEKVDPAPKLTKAWPAGSPDPDDVQKNDKDQHIIDRGPEGEWVFKLKTNKKFIVRES